MSDTKKFNLEEKVVALEAIEAYFQKPDLNLNEALEQHKKAQLLVKEILAYLGSVESELQEIEASFLNSGE